MQPVLGAWYHLEGQPDAMQCFTKNDDFWTFRTKDGKGHYVKKDEIEQQLICLVRTQGQSIA